MRVFKSKPFARFAEHEGLPDAVLCDAIMRAETGLVDADLGGGVIKQRVARPGHGKSGGYRSVILFRRGERAFFAYGFAKSRRNNLGPAELKVYKKLAGEMLGMDNAAISMLLKNGTIKELYCYA